MPAHLLTWNPAHLLWKSLSSIVSALDRGERKKGTWSCGKIVNIKPGSRVYLLRQGTDRPGIVGTGRVLTPPEPGEHWVNARATRGETVNYINIEWEHLVLPEDFLHRDRLLAEKLLPLPLVNARGSGMAINDPFLARLERAWSKHVVRAGSLQRAKTENWLGREKGSAASILDDLLRRGATLRELKAVRGGVNGHFTELVTRGFERPRPDTDGLYRLKKVGASSNDAIKSDTAPPEHLTLMLFKGALKETGEKPEGCANGGGGADMAVLARLRNKAGKRAEEIALKEERKRVAVRCSGDPATRVKLVAGDASLGYDILSCEADGKLRYIEVKNVTSAPRFFLTRNEWAKSRALGNYWFYLVDENNGRPLIEMMAAEQLKERHLVPTVFAVAYEAS